MRRDMRASALRRHVPNLYGSIRGNLSSEQRSIGKYIRVQLLVVDCSENARAVYKSKKMT